MTPCKWAFKNNLNNWGFSYVWLNQSHELLDRMLPIIRTRIINIKKQLDESKILNSTYYLKYKFLTYDGPAPSLLNLKIPLHIFWTLSQIRILGFPLTINNYYTYIFPTEPCKLCSVATNNFEDLDHIIYNCPLYQSVRNCRFP